MASFMQARLYRGTPTAHGQPLAANGYNSDMDLDELHEAWRVNNAINLEMLGWTSDEDLELKPGKGKTIRSNYVHMIGFRRAWCESKLKKESEAIPKLDWKTASRQELIDGLNVSSDVMQKFFEKIETTKATGKWSTLIFFSYAISHEANHRAQIELALRLNGKEPDDAVLYRLWEWTKK
jgi:uncharacterized damage-inducible protein DinB